MPFNSHTWLLIAILVPVWMLVAINLIRTTKDMAVQNSLSTLNKTLDRVDASLTRVEALPSTDAIAADIDSANQRVAGQADRLDKLAPLPVQDGG